MSRRPGIIIEMDDGRMAIVYNDQPLEFKDKIILNLITNDFKPVKGKDDKNATLIKSKDDYAKLLGVSKLMGHVD